ncbi:MAG: glycosyltransferase [Patescibacteria group bacterium]
MKKLKAIHKFYTERNINAWIVLFFTIYIVFLIKFITIQEIDNNIFFGSYSLAVTFYILSRFIISYFYEPDLEKFDANFQPTISFGIPSYNEGENIRKTLLKISQIDYPKKKFEIIAVNDASTDNTLAEMIKAQKIAKRKKVKIKIVNWKVNKGKREGMGEAVNRSKNDIIIFIDSDSFVEKRTAKELVKYFLDDKVAAVAGHAFVANADENFITKMQSARYFVAFKAYKAAEAMFDSVTCCSGCCSAYRRQDLLPVIDKWLNQRFLGIQCTYGDDRSLTNFVLRRGHKALYAPEAKSYTIVPNSFTKFMKQQLRWKKSWVRESLMAGSFIWRRHPLMSFSFYLGVILPLLAPVVVIRALIWYPFVHDAIPWLYLFGLILMAIVYGLYYYIHTRDRKWVFGVVFAAFYSVILIWQLPWAILTLRDSKWGTR